MENLELKHVKHYLGTGCRFGFNVEEIHDTAPKEFRIATLTHENISLCIDYGRLLLHPLERLTDKMLHDLAYTDKDRFILEVKNRVVSVVAWDDLITNHYDVFGLIEKGLAETIKLDQ